MLTGKQQGSNQQLTAHIQAELSMATATHTGMLEDVHTHIGTPNHGGELTWLPIDMLREFKLQIDSTAVGIDFIILRFALVT